MTAQFTEVLQRHGQNFRMCTEPLGEYFKLAGHKPDFIWPHTGLRRGYIGTWEISEEKLYLVDIDAQYKNGSKATLDSLFPGQPDRVFADWFSGEVRCPQGARLNYVHGGYESTYERDLLLRFDRGVLVEEHVRINSKPDPDTQWPRSANLANSSPKQTTESGNSMASINKIILLGNLGAAPEVRYTASGDVVANLRLATSESYKDKTGERCQQTEWHRIVLHRRLAEIARDFLSKGSTVYIEGRIKTRKWQDRDGKTVMARPATPPKSRPSNSKCSTPHPHRSRHHRSGLIR